MMNGLTWYIDSTAVALSFQILIHYQLLELTLTMAYANIM
jgi:hypothetical protein